MFNRLLKLVSRVGKRRVAKLDKAAARKFDHALELRRIAAQVLVESDKVHLEGLQLLEQAVALEVRTEKLAEV